MSSDKRRLPWMSPAIAGMLISAGATLFVAVTAFRLAYSGSKGAAQDAGLTAGDASWYPLCIEGALVVAAVGTVVVGGVYPWAMLIGFSLLSVAANVVHTYDHDGQHWNWFHVATAAVPPLALPLCVHLALLIAEHFAQSRKLAATDVPVTGAAAEQEESTDTPAPPAPQAGSTLTPLGVEPSTPESLAVGSPGSPAAATLRPGAAGTGQGSTVPPSGPPARPETASAGAPGSEYAPADAPYADADADTADAPANASVVHLRTASRTASGGGSRRSAPAASTASRPERITASADAPANASDTPDPALLDAVRAHLKMHHAYPSGRALAASERVHQDKARAAIAHIRAERGEVAAP